MIRSVFLTVVAIFILFACPLNAQWKLARQFKAPIACIQFLNDAGAPGTGFVGLENGEIWRTTDGGSSWTQSVIAEAPPPAVQGSAVQFAFKNPYIGWCATKDRIFRTQTPVLMTTDGGDHWNALPFVAQLSGIYYHQWSDQVILSTWDTGAYVSQDLGTTWTNIDTYGWDGAAFCSPLAGIITNVTGTHGGNVLVTTDGAKTWKRIFGLDESWQPEAIPNSQSYVVISEYSGRFLTSTDAGSTWKTLHSFGNDFPFGMTGCVRIDNCQNYYIQSVRSGFFKSLDGGTNWIPIGGPNGLLDSRFCIANGYIWTGDTNLYSYNLGPRTLDIYDSLPIRVQSTQCTPITTTIHFSSDCSNAIANFKSATLRGSPAISLPTQQMPNDLHTIDSIRIQYDPLLASSATDTLVLTTSSNGSDNETEIVIEAVDRSPHAFKLSTSPSISLQAKSCDSLHSAVHFFSTPSCNSALDSVISISSSTDPSVTIRSQLLPLPLSKIDSFVIAYDPQTSFNASTPVIVSLIVGGRRFDTTLTITATGPQQDILGLSQSTLSLEAHSCEKVTTSLHLTHQSCIPSHDTLISVSVDGNSAITVSPNGILGSLLGADNSLEVTFDPGQADSGSSLLHVTVSFGGVRRDTVIPISAKKYQVVPNRPYLRFDNGGKFYATAIDSPFSAAICLPAALPAGSLLDSIDIRLTFDGNELDAISALPLQHLTISDFEHGNGYVDLHLRSPSHDSLIADSALAQIVFIPYLSKWNFDKIAIDRVLYDTSTTLTDNCSYLLASSEDSLTVRFLNGCGDSTTRNYFNNKPLLQAFRIVPNPNRGVAHAIISVIQPITVRISLQDALGREVGRVFEGKLNAGDNQISITSNGTSGSEWIVLESVEGDRPIRISRAFMVAQ